MRKPRRLLKEHQVLQDLSREQVEQALKFLAQPMPDSVPPHLKDLSLVEWHLLHLLLQRELAEKGSSPVH